MQFNGELISPYQNNGVEWMAKRENSAGIKGGFLCDEMGLGKTVETIAAICHPSTYDGTTLIVCPASVVLQWRSEIDNFVGDHTKLPIHVMSYSMLMSAKYHWIYKKLWHRIVFDEAHELRNAKGKRHIEARKLYANIRWVVTGTPVFNTINDFKALAALVGIPVEWVNENASGVRREYVLRRTKDEVADHNDRLRLPPLNFHLHELELSDDEKIVYRQVWTECRGIAKQALRSEMKGYYNMLMIQCLLRARQCMVHPQLYLHGRAKEEGEDAPEWTGVSTKMDKLMGMIRNDVPEKTIIFTQFNLEQDILEAKLQACGWSVARFSGRESYEKKQEGLKRFKESQNPKSVILVQIKSGGVGLNIQEATRIFVMSPAWNPATELQAIARSHRTGQTKGVTVHKLAYLHLDDDILSIEQAMMNLQNAKQMVTAEVLGDQRLLEQIPSPKTKTSLKSLCALFLTKPASLPQAPVSAPVCA